MFRSLRGCFIVAMLALHMPGSLPGAGLTIITHGLNSNIDDWVISMAQKIPRYPGYRGTNYSCYEIYFVSAGAGYTVASRRLAGTLPTESGEIVVKLDWRQLANNSYSTYQVASMVVPKLLDTNFMADWPGHALAELPIHLIGHSRGGSLVCEMSNLLGTNGVWVDHLTTLDPHPLNNDGFSGFGIYTVVDAPAKTYENVLFHDDYFQTLDPIFNGEPVAGAYVRQLANLDGGYSGVGGSHSDVHLWYHGTIDLQTPTDDSVSPITPSQRQGWWTASESAGANAGFVYSLIGGGDRLSTNQPAGGSRIRDGYNQRWNLGAGVQTNRTALSTNRGNWASLITMEPRTNSVSFGQSISIGYIYQWARPDTSNAVIKLFLDDDWNPFNGNEQQLIQQGITGTGAAAVGSFNLISAVAATNATTGERPLFMQIIANGQSRYFYAAHPVTVMSSFAAPSLAINRNGGLHLSVNGVIGQRIVLETSNDLQAWQSIATNWMTQSVWSYDDQKAIGDRKFYRAAVR